MGMFATILDKIFPMPGKKWSFNLTHVILMAILISILSMVHHPAQDALEENAYLQRKKREKAESKKENSKDE